MAERIESKNLRQKLIRANKVIENMNVRLFPVERLSASSALTAAVKAH